MVVRISETAERASQRFSRKPPPRVQRILLGAALALIAVGAVFAVRRLELSLADLRWAPIAAAALLGVPLTLFCNALEYQVSVRVAGARTSLREALRVTVVASAANLLPVPGGALVRVQALRQNAVGYRRAVAATTLVGLVWLGVSAVLGSLVLVALGVWLGALVLAGVGAFGFATGLGLLLRITPAGRQRRVNVRLLVLVEALFVGAGALRLLLLLWGLGVDADPAQALVLAVSAVLSAAVGVFPGGWGLREAIAAALAPLVGLPATLGFLVSGLNGVVGVVALLPVTAAVMALKDPQFEEARAAAHPDGPD